MTSPAPDDHVLAALDRFTNTVYWLRSRTSITAADALAEALGDWTSDDRRDPVDLRIALRRLLDQPDDDAIPEGFAEALDEWSTGISAEHNASQPFQPSARAEGSGRLPCGERP